MFWGHTYIEGKTTRPNFFVRIFFLISRKLFALTILRVEFRHFYLRALARGFNLCIKMLKYLRVKLSKAKMFK
jgi:hypothetical protein